MPSYTGQRGSGFTSLKQYLELNPESAQRMGDDLVSDVNAKGTAAEQDISSAMRTFGDKANAATLRYDPNVATSAEALQRAGGTYTGPKELKDVADVNALGDAAKDAQNRAKALGTDAGRATLLGEKYGANGGYTPGAAGLDAFLAGRGAGGRAQQAAQRWGGLKAFLDTTTEGAQHLGADAAATSANAAQQYRTQAGILGQREALAASQAQLAAARQHTADLNQRNARAADRTGNTTTVNTRGNTGSDTGTYAGADNQVSPGRKGPRTDDDYNKRLRGYP